MQIYSFFSENANFFLRCTRLVPQYFEILHAKKERAGENSDTFLYVGKCFLPELDALFGSEIHFVAILDSEGVNERCYVR